MRHVTEELERVDLERATVLVLSPERTSWTQPSTALYPRAE
jgi:hypothetical protein